MSKILKHVVKIVTFYYFKLVHAYNIRFIKFTMGDFNKFLRVAYNFWPV